MMDIQKFAELWEEGFPPGQDRMEWFLFLKFMSDYWETNRILNPVVVEIGIRRGRQKRFWEELGATHVGVDVSDRYAKPWITGDSHNPHVHDQVQERLRSLRANGLCDLLFIDGDHTYLGVKQDWEMYGDLSHMTAIHDIHCLRCDVQVNEFWRKLRETTIKNGKGFTFMEFFKPHPPDHYGIGVILKEV